MNYPFWDIPILGSGWVIGIIAIFHVMISQFAVGGGLYLPLAERKAMRMPEGPLRDAWLTQLAVYSKFSSSSPPSSAPSAAWESGSPLASRTLRPPAR